MKKIEVYPDARLQYNRRLADNAVQIRATWEISTECCTAGTAKTRSPTHTVSASNPMNAIMVIFPYRHQGTWVFDDESVGLRQEPFVSGADNIIDRMAAALPDAENGFRMVFS